MAIKTVQWLLCLWDSLSLGFISHNFTRFYQHSITVIRKGKVRNLDGFKYKYAPLVLFLRGVKIAFSASCFHTAGAMVTLTEVPRDILAGYKILQL